MREERFEAVSRAGEEVVVRWRPEELKVEVQVGPTIHVPAWGSQACDDRLDWMAAERRQDPIALPVDEDDWLLD